MVFIIILVLMGCGGSNFSKTEIIQDDVLAYISDQEDNSVGDLYLIEENEERKKISSNMLQDAFVFLPSSKALLYIDKDYTLCYQGSEGNKVAITDDVKPNSVVVSGNEKTFAYLKGDKWDLYVQKIEGGKISDRVKVASDISYGRYILSYNGNKIIYLNNEDTLYIKEGTEPPKRIASNVFNLITLKAIIPFGMLTMMGAFTLENWKKMKIKKSMVMILYYSPLQQMGKALFILQTLTMNNIKENYII
jgi:hypothetical protein